MSIILLLRANIIRYTVILHQNMKNWLTPYFYRVSYSIPYSKGFAAYFSLGIGICFGGLSMKDFSNWCIISDKGRSCSSLSLSSNFLTSSVVRNEINSDLLCLIEYIMLDKNNLNHNIYNIRLCMTIYEYI